METLLARPASRKEGGGEEEEEGERERNKASNTLARTPVHADPHTHTHSDGREMNKAAVPHHGAPQMTNSDMVGSGSEERETDSGGVSRAAASESPSTTKSETQ